MSNYNPTFPYIHNIIINFNIQANNIQDNINNLANKLNNLHTLKQNELQNNSPNNIIEELNQEINFISKQIVKQQKIYNKLNSSVKKFINISKKVEEKYQYNNKWAINKIVIVPN